MTGTLEELMAQKKAIERKIQELKRKTSSYGIATCGMESYPTDKPDRWYISILASYRDGSMRSCDGRARRVAVINGLSKEEVIGKIPTLIRDLQGLYEQEGGKQSG